MSDWIDENSALFLLILLATLIVSSLRRKTPVDLVFLGGGAATLILGLTPAKEFIHTLSNVFFLSVVAIFLVGTAVRQHLRTPSFETSIWKDPFQLLPASFWVVMISAFLFVAAFLQTPLLKQLALQLSWIGDPFLVLSLLMVAVYLFTQFMPALVTLLLFLPLSVAALQTLGYSGHIQITAATALLFATLMAVLFPFPNKFFSKG